MSFILHALIESPRDASQRFSAWPSIAPDGARDLGAVAE
jgi:hypothetical protein